MKAGIALEGLIKPMPFARSHITQRWVVLPLIGALVAISVGVASADTSKRITVSQRGRAFSLGAIVIQRGDTLEIVNDDGNVVHHAYVDDPEFSFDSEDQDPADTTDIAFTKSGSFTVLCDIHPKMQMTVTVLR